MVFDTHTPVMLPEVLESLQIVPQGLYVDATFGRGGHTRAILNALGTEGRLWCMDQDPAAITYGRAHFGDDPRITWAQGSFAHLAAQIAERWGSVALDGILLDLGVSTPQLRDPIRGFSFQHDGPLDMRMDPSRPVSAADWLRDSTVKEMEWAFKTYGEERYARRVARAIDRIRSEQPLTRTAALAALVARTLPYVPHKHPATRVFQAIRIAVNGELTALQQVLGDVLTLLAPRGRIVVISFHSLEDRIVKRWMAEHAIPPALPPGVALRECDRPRPVLAVLPKRLPGALEVASDPAARSAVLRVAQRRADAEHSDP